MDTIKTVHIHYANCPCGGFICYRDDNCPDCDGLKLTMGQFRKSNLLVSMLKHMDSMPKQWTCDGEREHAVLCLESSKKEWALFMHIVCDVKPKYAKYTCVDFNYLYACQPSPDVMRVAQCMLTAKMKDHLNDVHSTIYLYQIMDALGMYSNIIPVDYTNRKLFNTQVLVIAWIALEDTGFTLDIFDSESLKAFVKEEPEHRVTRMLRDMVDTITSEE